MCQPSRFRRCCKNFKAKKRAQNPVVGNERRKIRCSWVNCTAVLRCYSIVLMPGRPPKPYLRRGEGIARFGNIKYPILCKASSSTSSKDSGHGSDSLLTMASSDSSLKVADETKVGEKINLNFYIHFLGAQKTNVV